MATSVKIFTYDRMRDDDDDDDDDDDADDDVR